MRPRLNRHSAPSISALCCVRPICCANAPALPRARSTRPRSPPPKMPPLPMRSGCRSDWASNLSLMANFVAAPITAFSTAPPRPSAPTASAPPIVSMRNCPSAVEARSRSRLSAAACNGTNAADADFLKTRSDRWPKITIPGPCALHFRGGDAAVTASAYHDVDQFWSDTIDAFTSELRALAAAGCRYVQIDETAFAKFGDPQVQSALAARGDDWSALIDKYIAVTNSLLAAGRRTCISACTFAGAIAAVTGTPKAATKRLRNGCSMLWPSDFICSNTTRRAPAASRRCALCRSINQWCSGLSPRRFRSLRTGCS